MYFGIELVHVNFQFYICYMYVHAYRQYLQTHVHKIMCVVLIL